MHLENNKTLFDNLSNDNESKINTSKSNTADFFVEFKDTAKLAGHCFGVFSGVVPTPDEYECKADDKPFSRFFYVENNTIIFNSGTEEEVCAKTGDIVYLPNNVTYKSKWPGGTEGRYISVNFQAEEQYLRLPDKICIAASDKNEYYHNMFRKIYAIWIKGAFGYKFEILSEIYRLVYTLANDSLRLHTKSKHQAIYKGILYLEDNYLEDISVEELSFMCNVSESSFRRLFKSYKGMSPITYKNYLRIIKSCDLLRTGEYTVKEAAYAVNIPDICYFYKLFTRFIGITPKEYLNNQ